MTGRKELFPNCKLLEISACSRDAESDVRIQSKVLLVPTVDAHAGIAATYCCQLASFLSGANAVPEPVDSII